MNGPQIPPPGSAAPPSPSGAAGPVVLPSEIVRLPQELAARLLSGPRTVFVSGTVTGQGADGSLQIRSQFGEIAVRAGTAVPADRQVSLQIPPLSGKAAALTPSQLSGNPIPASLLLTKPIVPQAAAQASGSTIGSPAGARAAASPGVASSPGAASTIVPPAATAVSIPLTGPLTGAPPSAAAPAPAAAPIQQQGGQTVQPAQTSAGPSTPGNGPTPPSPGTPSPDIAGRPAPPAQTALPTQAATAGSSPAQAPAAPAATTVAAAPLGRLALTTQLLTQSATPPAAASTATTTATTTQPAVPSPGAAPQTPGAAPQIPTAPASGAGAAPTAGQIPSAAAADMDVDVLPPESMRRVPSLREAVSVLSAANPGLATQFVQSVLPQSNTQLAATLLFFLAATRSGDIRGWMGERVTSTLDDSGRGDLLAKLSAELATPARALPESPAAEWRSQTVPLYQDGDIGGMTVHVRRPGEESDEGGDGTAAGQRFLIDMDLSRMGPLQFDGLVHDKRFDLTIRSPAAFPQSMRQDMRALFRDASDAVGLHGGLTFQAGGHDWATVATVRGR